MDIDIFFFTELLILLLLKILNYCYTPKIRSIYRFPIKYCIQNVLPFLTHRQSDEVGGGNEYENNIQVGYFERSTINYVN